MQSLYSSQLSSSLSPSSGGGGVSLVEYAVSCSTQAVFHAPTLYHRLARTLASRGILACANVKQHEVAVLVPTTWSNEKRVKVRWRRHAERGARRRERRDNRLTLTRTIASAALIPPLVRRFSSLGSPLSSLVSLRVLAALLVSVRHGCSRREQSAQPPSRSDFGWRRVSQPIGSSKPFYPASERTSAAYRTPPYRRASPTWVREAKASASHLDLIMAPAIDVHLAPPLPSLLFSCQLNSISTAKAGRWPVPV